MASRSDRLQPWTRADTLERSLTDVLVVLFGFAACWAFTRNVSPRLAQVAWTGVLLFYFLFYRRVAYVVFWARDTYNRLGETIAVHGSDPAESSDIPGEESPTPPRFHVLVAAYNAADSIGPVMRALDAQAYPRDRFDAWIITTNREIRQTRSTRRELIEGVSSGSPASGEELRARAALHWWSQSMSIPDLRSWVRAISGGALSAALNTPGADLLLVRDLLGRLLRLPDWRGQLRAGVLKPLALSAGEGLYIRRRLAAIEARTRRVADDFKRLLGGSDIYSAHEVEQEILDADIRCWRLRRIGRRIAARFGVDAEGSGAVPVGPAARRLMRTTQERVKEVIAELGTDNIHHFDSPAEGFKPGALNAAHRHLRDAGHLDDLEDTYFIVIDADSLLPRHALRAVAAECELSKHTGIMQMASVPTANFFGAGWFSRFVAFTDAIGAVGKWARSTRRQLRPDMAAGSGVVVAAHFAEHVAEHAGSTWDESTLTEDARLIVGQFGLTEGARSKTRMAPVYLLEAVPASRSFARTYRSYWNQRRRWTIGGFDEFFYMVRVPDWVKHARFERDAGRWTVARPALAKRALTRLAQCHRALLWAWDHFWWGFGSAVVLTHWSLISVFVAEPTHPVFLLGLSALLLLPLVFLVVVGPKLSPFIPGGLTPRVAIALYFLAFPTIWLYVAPVLWTQLACLLGLRPRVLDWRPTQKPRYDSLVPFAKPDATKGALASTLHLEVK